MFKRTADLMYNNLLFASPSNTWNPAEQFNILDLSFYYRMQKSQQQKDVLVYISVSLSASNSQNIKV